MEVAQSLREHIQGLEQQLLRPDVRRSRELLDELLADEFVEFASDGAAYGKSQVIAALQAEPSLHRSLADFHLVQLAEDVLLSTYRSSRHGDAAHEAVESLRSSIWKQREGKWQMIFHQGTVCAKLPGTRRADPGRGIASAPAGQTEKANSKDKEKDMDPVVHFEMPFDNRERMAKFYASAFGWQTQMMGEDMGNYVLATTTETDEKGPKKPGSINGGFFPKKPDWPAQHPSIVIAVDNIKESMKKVTSAGGKVLGDPMEIPGVGQYVSFTDTEGNRISMLQPNPRDSRSSKQGK